ncbi:hypothetical protein LMG23994_00414 [Cupriavidus pinatubonensis]|uniref:Uncharacterized protein n=2 Tax=Cupriavidus pinatubonensis TaxID=248026 RepID=A0ABM8WBE2_9BURK|nr:hypothetical protein LMG23994_00414 [Cupriavidus pinatubonensis]
MTPGRFRELVILDRYMNELKAEISLQQQRAARLTDAAESLKVAETVASLERALAALEVRLNSTRLSKAS